MLKNSAYNSNDVNVFGLLQEAIIVFVCWKTTTVLLVKNLVLDLLAMLSK